MRKAFIQLHIAVLLAGLTGILGRLISLNEGLLVWYRLFITAISLWLLAAIRRQDIRIDRRDLWRIIGIGGIAALHWVFFYGSIKYSNVSIALLCFSAIGFFTAIIEPLVMRHRFDFVELLLGLLVIVGIFFIFQVDPHYKTGIWLGLISSLLASLFPVLNKRILQRVPPETVTLYELSGGWLVLTVLMPFYLWLFPTPSLLPDLTDLGWLLILSWACTVLAFNLGLLALQKISAFTVSLTYNLEPVYGIFLAFVVFREDKYLNKGFYVGLGIILASIVLQTFRLLRMTKKPVLACFFLLFFAYGGLAQTGNPDPVDRLRSYFATNNPERAWLVFDRPWYAPGDTLFFKAFVTQTGYHTLSGVSGALHVDLINATGKIDRSIQLRLDGGVGWGEFALPDSIPGNYRIRAYTEWMRNLGEEGFYDRYVVVRSKAIRPAPQRLTKQLPKGTVSVRFFPEGRTFVENVKTKVAFKAIGANGLGTDVRGVIVDKADKQVCSFASTHLGMGYFYLLPEKGNEYRARLNLSDGRETVVDLPKPDSSGITLSVVNDSSHTLSITMKTNSVYFHANRNKEFLLVIYSGGKAIRYPFKQDEPMVTFDLDKKVLQSGICRFTLFTGDNKPLCERLVYVRNDDQLKLQMQPDKPEYGKREKVDLTLNAKTVAGVPANGHFSVTIVDEGQQGPDEKDERNMEAGLLLSSELEGYVEEPAYYVDDTSPAARENLDVLLLTQTDHNFDWKKVLRNDTAVITFLPEKGLEIAGKITDLTDKPIANGTVTLLAAGGGSLLSSQSDNNGLFHFPNLFFTDTLHGVLSAVNAKGKNSTRITSFMVNYPSPIVHQLAYSLGTNEGSGMSSNAGSANAGSGKLLKPVTVRGTKEDMQYRTQNLAGAGNADQVIHADQLEKVGAKLSTSLTGRLRGVDFVNGVPYLSVGIQTNTEAGVQSMLIVLDGMKLPPGINSSVDDIPTEQVETVEMLRSGNTSTYGMDGANGVLIITTKSGNGGNKAVAAVGVVPVTAVGFYKARYFTETAAGPVVYWNPEIRTDKDGNVRLTYRNADHAGSYKIIVEGIDDNGYIGRLIYHYKVE